MLFMQLNGQASPVEDSTVTDILENVACSIGPAVDGIQASRALPQAMGAFVTAGAQGACAGNPGQQREQHSPTTSGSFGRARLGAALPFIPGILPTPLTTPLTSLISNLPSSKPIFRTNMPLPGFGPGVSSNSSQIFVTAQNAAQNAAAGVGPGNPTGSVSPTGFPSSVTLVYPPGSVTALSSKTGQWRVAIPVGTSIPGVATAPPVAGAAFVEVTPVPTPPVGITQISESQFDADVGIVPFFKKPLFLAAVAGVVVIGAGFFIMRRRKTQSAAASTSAKAAYYGR